ncbi:MAG: hypothetical protein Q4B03_04270 [Lachnospiraceae bacterium]|nr:hypothetical protein [Lachnospiraceae bacterium]
MALVNVLEAAGSIAAVAAISGFGLVYLGAICVGLIKEAVHH